MMRLPFGFEIKRTGSCTDEEFREIVQGIVGIQTRPAQVQVVKGGMDRRDIALCVAVGGVIGALALLCYLHARKG